MKKITLENINDATGIILLLSGIINLTIHEWEMALGWIIFGCMYLVMEGYDENIHNYKRKLYFGYVGILSSIILLIFYVIS